jgi:hypothetical protein
MGVITSGKKIRRCPYAGMSRRLLQLQNVELRMMNIEVCGNFRGLIFDTRNSESGNAGSPMDAWIRDQADPNLPFASSTSATCFRPSPSRVLRVG